MVGCATVSTIRRAAVWGSSSACITVLMSPHGTTRRRAACRPVSPRCRAQSERVRDQAVDDVAIFHPRAIGGKTGVLGPLGMAQHLGVGAGELSIVAEHASAIMASAVG